MSAPQASVHQVMDSADPNLPSPTGRIAFWVALSAILLASRLANINVLWTDEDYHLAATVQLLHGKMLYRDLWYDKPPLNAWLFLLFGGWPGWPLRVFGTVVAILSCVVSFQFASRAWSRKEGYLAASLMAFSQIFYFAHATIPLEPDTLMIAPHLAAVYLAWRGRPLGAGVATGIAFLLNPKAAFVGLSCLAFLPMGTLAIWLTSLVTLAAGFLLPNVIAMGALASQGAAEDFFAQVWRWGMMYAAKAPPDMGEISPAMRPLNWLAFHALLGIGMVRFFFSKTDSPRNRSAFAFWTFVSLAAAGIGLRFSPHYMNQLVPPLVIGGARGLSLLLYGNASALPAWRASSPAWRKAMLVVILAALIFPIVRFAPNYVELVQDDLADRDHTWVDVHMDQDSRTASQIINSVAQPTDTIFIWGYRPNLIAYTRLPVVSKFWESQPVTGVPADRHLSNSVPLDADWAARNLRQLVKTRPNIIVDALSAYNPSLAIRSTPEMANWMLTYCEVGDTGLGITVYQRCR